jgi:hypothetical protein
MIETCACDGGQKDDLPPSFFTQSAVVRGHLRSRRKLPVIVGQVLSLCLNTSGLTSSRKKGIFLVLCISFRTDC